MPNFSKEEFLANVGSRLAMTRNQHAVSQSTFATAAGLSLRAYQSYEMGKRSIPIEALVLLNSNFQLDLDWILLGLDVDEESEFAKALDEHLKRKGLKLTHSKRSIILEKWSKSLSEGRRISMDEVHTWIELAQE